MNPEFTAQSILPSSEEVPNRPTQYYPVVFAPDTAEDGAAPKPIYNAQFESQIMKLVLDNDKNILAASMPMIIPSTITSSIPPLGSELPLTELPLSLSDRRRIYPSTIPGIHLTHPHGSLYGGRIPYSRKVLREEIADIMDREGIQTRDGLVRRVKKDIDGAKRDLVKTMKARKAALDHNERIRAQLRQLEEDREDQVMFERRWRKEKEERERRKREMGRDG
jgi:hypothetical protein